MNFLRKAAVLAVLSALGGQAIAATSFVPVCLGDARPYALISYSQSMDDGRPTGFWVASVSPDAVPYIDHAINGHEMAVSSAALSGMWAQFLSAGATVSANIIGLTQSVNEAGESVYMPSGGGFLFMPQQATSVELAKWVPYNGGLYPPYRLVGSSSANDMISVLVPLYSTDPTRGDPSTTADALGVGIYAGHGVLTERAEAGVNDQERLWETMVSNAGSGRRADMGVSASFDERGSPERQAWLDQIAAREGTTVSGARSKQNAALSEAYGKLKSAGSGKDTASLAYMIQDMTKNAKIERVGIVPMIDCRPLTSGDGGS